MRVQLARLLVVLTTLVFPGSATAQPQCAEAPKKFEDVIGLRGSPVIFVEKVVPLSAAETAGISRFDLIVAFNGQNMRQFPTTENFLAELRIAAITDRAEIEILKYDQQSGSYSPSRVSVTLAESTERYIGLRSRFGYLVLEVSDGAVADKMGVKPGYFIHDVNGERVSELRGPQDLDKMFQDIASGPSHQFTLSLARWTPAEGGRRKVKTQKLTGSL